MLALFQIYRRLPRPLRMLMLAGLALLLIISLVHTTTMLHTAIERNKHVHASSNIH